MSVLNPGQEKLDLEHFDVSNLQVIKETEPNPQPSTIITKQKNDVKDENILQILNSGFRTDKRLNLLKELFKEHKKLTRNQIMKITNVGPTTATKDLQTLISTGFIVRRSPTKSPSTDYFELVE